MNWKIAVGGLVAMLALLGAMAASDVVWGFTGGTIYIKVPKAELENVEMYGDTYQNTEGPINVVTQRVGRLKCSQGQIVKRHLGMGAGLDNVVIKFDNATLINVLMKAKNLLSQTGTLSGVTMWVEPSPKGLQQNITGGTMDNLETDIYYVSIGSLGYTGLSIYFE
ncbi:MAG: hypothetical protein QXF20_01045 [Candidatus Hadarchaeales archaeon]